MEGEKETFLVIQSFLNQTKANSVVGLQSVTPIYWRYTSLLRAFVDTAQYCRRKKTEQKSNVVAVVV